MHYSKFHKMMVDHGATPEAIERQRRVRFIGSLRAEGKVKVFIDHRQNETVAEFGGAQLRAPIAQFPTDTIFTQLLLVFG